MIIIGERLNSTRKPVFQALHARDEKYLLNEAFKQEKAGADYIDLNTATLLEQEISTLKWAIPLLQKKLKIPLCIDTPNPEAMSEGLRIHKGKALLNSLSGESQRMKAFLPLIEKHKPRVIVLCLDDKGIPIDPDDELSIAEKMVNLLLKKGTKAEDIFIDPLVRPIGVDPKAGKIFFDSLEKIKKNIPRIKTIAGISNVSFGLPRRRLLNRAFLVLAIEKGLDAAILDPLDTDIIGSLFSTQALLGEESAMKNYLGYIRRKRKEKASSLPGVKS